MLSSEDFTPSATIDEFQPGDSTIDIVGYVIGCDSNFHTTFTTKFKKFVCCNADGRNVQVIAWKELITKLDNIELGMIVHINSLKYNIPRKEYNKGNVNFELLIQDSSEITKFGTYSKNQSEITTEEVSLLEAYNKIGEKIKVEGVVKTEPAIYQNRNFVSTVASLTNTIEQLELKLKFTPDQLKKPLLKGITITAIGTMEKYSPGPALLRVEDPDDIEVVAASRISFIEIINGFRTKETI